MKFQSVKLGRIIFSTFSIDC